jgi:hypothetical protein
MATMRHLNGRRRFARATMALCVALATSGCGSVGTLGTLAQLIQPPRFEQSGQSPDIRFRSPSLSEPLGGAGITLWIRVTNPNPFGFTLSTLDATLLLEDQRAAAGSFPLGLPLGALQDSVVPIDLSVSFADLPALAGVLRQATARQPVAYQLDGTIGVDAGRLGQPTFGPMLLVRGEITP